MGKRKYPIEPCPRCKSRNTKVYEWDNKFGSRRYYCNDCKQMFTIRLRPSKIKPRKGLSKVKPIALLPKTITKPLCSLCGQIVCICKELAEEKKRLAMKHQREIELREKMKTAISLDSVKNVPCFFCLEQNRHCTESCQDLEDFLLGGLQK